MSFPLKTVKKALLKHACPTIIITTQQTISASTSDVTGTNEPNVDIVQFIMNTACSTRELNPARSLRHARGSTTSGKSLQCLICKPLLLNEVCSR